MIPRFRTFLPCCLLSLSAIPAFAQSWLETLIEIDDLHDAGDYTAAAERGSELVEIAAREFGETSEQHAEAHMIAAEMHVANSDLRNAETSILSAIDIYDDLDGSASTMLIEPYTALGDAYQADGEHELALGAYFEARSLNRRAYGLYGPEQLEVVYRMADASADSGDIDSAIELQEDALYIVLRTYGEGRASYEALYRLSGWLSEREYYTEAARYYGRASNQLLFAMTGSDPLEIVHTLRLAAKNYRLSASKLLRPPSDLYRALQIVRSMGDEQLLLEAEVLRDIGDWYVGSGNDAEMEEAYFRSWHTLAGLDNADEIREEWFSRTAVVYLAPFRARELSSSGTAPQGFVEVQFTVDPNGTADHIDVIGGDPEGLLDSDARQRVNNSRFRPGVEEGRVVEATRVIRFNFRYDPKFASD